MKLHPTSQLITEVRSTLEINYYELQVRNTGLIWSSRDLIEIYMYEIAVPRDSALLLLTVRKQLDNLY